MSLLDAKPPKPVTGFRKHVPLPLLVIFAIIISFLATYALWDYPEERAITTFLNTLEAGNYQQAYKLWQPSPSYSYNDFVHDWGLQGDYGKIRTFDILDSDSKGSETVLVTVRINHVNPPLGLLVDRKTKGLAYSFY
ncbi:MAG TPA: hypothetical protein VMX16_02705 [Terriglobia bacterium]|nr:hypothetical protein [Terriglobia bacterium]